MSIQVTRVRRSALPLAVDWKLTHASVGDRVRLTVYGVPSDAVITELSSEWVEFRTEADR